MKRFRHPVIAALSAAVALLVAGTVPAEIYRWVDEQGNVHFGDRPRDPERAAVAAPVEVQENYQPPRRTPEEQAVLEREARENFETSTRRLQHERESREAARAERRQQSAERCLKYREHLDKLTRVEVDGAGRRVRHYLSENGGSVSAREQEAYVEELRAKMTEAGCQ